jgi:hypothetical protein
MDSFTYCESYGKETANLARKIHRRINRKQLANPASSLQDTFLNVPLNYEEPYAPNTKVLPIFDEDYKILVKENTGSC